MALFNSDIVASPEQKSDFCVRFAAIFLVHFSSAAENKILKRRGR